MPPSHPVRRTLLFFAPLLLIAAAACSNEEAPGDGFAARVGDQRLNETEIADALTDLPLGLDSVTARQQVIEQWVRNRLLVEEAHRQGIAQREDVQQQLEESEQSVLVASLIDSFFETNAEEPTDAEVQEYFDRNVATLSLREPYLRVRLLKSEDEGDIRAIRTALIRNANSPFADSLWNLTVNEYADDAEGAHTLSQSFIPQSRLFGLDEGIAQAIRTLPAGGTSEVFESGGYYQVVQVVERIAAGTTPELEWIRDELTRRLAIEKRNSMLIRQIEQLKNEAEADGRLEIR